jgi:RhoGAP domain
MYKPFIDVMKIEDYNTRLIEIKNLTQKLPKVHYDVLEYLMRHLVKVSSKSDINKMEPTNLAIVYGPSLIRAEEKGEGDMQAAYANMMNMSFQNSLIENMITQTEVRKYLISSGCLMEIQTNRSFFANFIKSPFLIFPTQKCFGRQPQTINIPLRQLL